MTGKVSMQDLQTINVKGGDVRKGLSVSELSYASFGELYFSEVQHNYIKGWKMHTRMTCNLIVPIGCVKFVTTLDKVSFAEYFLGRNQYRRLTIPPNVWFAFQGVESGVNLIANVANIEHEADEAISADLSKIKYNW